MIAAEDIQLQPDGSCQPCGVLDCGKESASESSSSPGLDDLDVIEEGDIRSATGVVESNPRPADGFTVGICLLYTSPSPRDS